MNFEKHQPSQEETKKAEEAQEETPQTEKVEKTKNPKDVFLDSLNEELSAMEQSGRITPEQAEEKRKYAALIEFRPLDDPQHYALLFSRAGVADEKELVGIIDEKNAKQELSTVEDLDEDSPVKDFIEVAESTRHAYGERLQKDISESERLELIQAILGTGRVTRYFKSIEPRLKDSKTIEEIITEDRAELEAIKRGTGDSKEMARERTLRLAEIAVRNVKEKKEL